MEQNLLKYGQLFFLPFILSLIFTPIVRRFAIKSGLISFPRSDRWHKHPTAILGGIAIFSAALISTLFILGPGNKNMLAVFAGGTFLFVVGLLDDKFHFAPYTKLFAQLVAASLAVFFGIVIGPPVHTLLAIPLTLLWIIGITNSFNLLDNIDGLAAGISAISSLMLFFSSVIYSNNALGVFGLILSGAALGFLPYNFNPAKIFMGDSGSMFLGYCLAVIAIGPVGAAIHISNLLVTLLVPVLILSVPIFDTVFVMIIRKLQGRKIFEGGKDHTSHRLVTLGLSQRKTVLVLYAISIAFGLIAVLYSTLNAFVISVIALLAVIILLFFGLFLSEVTFYPDPLKKQKKFSEENKTLINSIFLHKRRIVEVLLDFILICVAYYAAYFLRFEGVLVTQNMYLVKESLLWIILIKMSIFFAFGLYRGVWRYISISDLLTIFKAVAISSVSAVLFLTLAFRFKGYSRAVFFMDWIILLFLISGTRISFRVLGEFFSRVRQGGSHILIFGAGDTGEMVIREIKRNKGLHLSPVGFIDDDPSKIGNKIQGVKVLGSRHKIKDLAKQYEIKEVLIAIPSIDIAEFSDIVKICRDCGLSYRRIRGILDKDEAADFEKN